MVIMISILTAAMVQTSGTAFGKIYELDGNGTMDDPYQISSADDLRIVSGSHHLHNGAYYKQTKDIVFYDDLSGSTVTLSVSVGKGSVAVSLSVNVSYGITEAYAHVSMNDSVTAVDWNDGFDKISFQAKELKTDNSLVAAGSVNGELFAIGLSFTDKDENAEITAPFKGNFKPIGSEGRPFTGVYDGNGYSITGLRVAVTSSPNSSTETRAGLFGTVADSVLYDITIASENNNRSYSIAAVINSPTWNSLVRSNLVSGGIVASGDDSAVISCSVDGTVSSFITDAFSIWSKNVMSLNHRVITGGIMGKGSGKIIDCRASGTVSAVSAVSVRHISEGQGALGYQGVTVKVEIGGLIGHAERIDVKKSGNAAAIYTSSFISLKMIGSGGSFDDLLYVPEMDICAGGIAGYVNNGGTFMDTYNSGEVAVAACSRADGGHEAFEVIYTAGCVAGYNSDMTLTIKNFCNMGRIIYAPPADSLSTGIKQTYPVAPGKVENCYYLHLSGAQQSNATAIRDSDAADEGTFKGWDFGRTWTIRDGRPVISVCYDMSIKDMSGTFDGTVKYSLDREHSFDANGRSFSCVGGEGFVLTLSEGYENSEITVYMIDGGEKMILEDRGNNNYMVPPSFFLHAYLEGREISGIELYIEGLGINLPPVIEDIIDDPVIIITDALSEETGTAVLMMFGLLIAMLSAVTMYNARSTGSILTISAEVRGTHEDEENEHTG